MEAFLTFDYDEEEKRTTVDLRGRGREGGGEREGDLHCIIINNY